MADGDIVSDVDGHVVAYVNGAVFLDVGFCADGDGGVVAADDGVVQDAAVAANGYVSKDDGLLGDSCALIYFYIFLVHFLTSFCSYLDNKNLCIFSISTILAHKKEIVYSFANIQSLFLNTYIPMIRI